MTRTWSACSATAAGCTGPGRSSTPWGRGRGALQAPHQPDHEGERHGRLLFQGRLQATPGQAERRPGSQHPRPRVQWLCAAHPSGLRPGLREGRCLMVVRLPARRPGQPADRRPFRGSRARHRPRAGRVRRAALPPDEHPGAPHGPRRRVRRRKDGAHARRVRYHAFPFQARQPVRQRGGGIHRPSHQEGTHVRQRLHERGTAALGPEQVRVVVRPPAAPLDPRLHESRGVHATRKDPPGTVQHTVANPRARRAL